jgi:hypothetical protein
LAVVGLVVLLVTLEQRQGRVLQVLILYFQPLLLLAVAVAVAENHSHRVLLCLLLVEATVVLVVAVAQTLQ